MNAPPEPAASHPAASRTIVNAVVLSMADDQDWFRGWIQIGADGRIAALGSGDPPHSPDALGVVDDVGGAFVAPGFVSAHSHLYTSGMGMTPGEPLYGWVQVQAALMTGTDIEDAYWMTLHGCLDFIDNGITSAYNFTCTRLLGGYDAATDSRTVVQEQPPEFVHRQIDAGRDAGLRVANAIRLDTELQPVDQAYELFGRTVEYVRQALPADLDLGPSVFGAQQWSDTPETSRHEARAMDTHGLGNRAHFLETSEALDSSWKFPLVRAVRRRGLRLVLRAPRRGDGPAPPPPRAAAWCGNRPPTAGWRPAWPNRPLPGAGHAHRRRPRRPVLHRSLRSVPEHADWYLHPASGAPRTCPW